MSLPKEGYLPMGINKKTYELLCQLQEGDKITVRIKEKNVYQSTDTFNRRLEKATITGFNHHYDIYPIRIIYDADRDKTYSIKLSWIEIDESILRDIKINRILAKI